MIGGLEDRDMKTARKSTPIDATTKTTTYTSERFMRTALVISGKGPDGSVDIVTEAGARLAQINIFLTDEGTLMVDVIDVDKRFARHMAVAFPNRERKAIPDCGPIVGAHFTPTK
jgi:hypothetical protein